MKGFQYQQNKTDIFFSGYGVMSLKRTMKFLVVTLVDPFFVDCIVLDKSTTYYSTSRFHDIHGI